VNLVIGLFHRLQHGSVRHIVDILSDGRLRQNLLVDRAADEASRRRRQTGRPTVAPD
jgi:hypothetical protein